MIIKKNLLCIALALLVSIPAISSEVLAENVESKEVTVSSAEATAVTAITPSESAESKEKQEMKRAFIVGTLAGAAWSLTDTYFTLILSGLPYIKLSARIINVFYFSFLRDSQMEGASSKNRWLAAATDITVSAAIFLAVVALKGSMNQQLV